MATLTLYQKTRKGKQHHPIYLRITHNRKSRLVNLDIRLTEEDWNAEKGVVRKNHPNSTWLNNYLKSKKAEAQREIIQLKTNGKPATVGKLQEVVEGNYKDLTDFFDFAEDILDDLKKQKKYNQRRNYKVVIGRLKKFHGEDTLPFSQINLTFIRKFAVYLESTYNNKPNTVANYMKKIRKIFNDAIREDYVDRSLYPFDQYSMPSNKTYKTKLSYRQIQDMEALKLPKGSRRCDSRNLFVFAFYARGMRFRDVVKLQWKHIKGNRLQYDMSKTGQRMNMKVIPKMQDILDNYRPEKGNPDPEGFIFPFFEKRYDYSDKAFLDKQVSSKNALVNKFIKKVAKKAKIKENVSLHVARHSFAYHCLKQDKSIFTIKDLLGHTDIKTTLLYLKSLGADHLDKEVDDIF